MQTGLNFSISASAAAELGRQAAFAGLPGEMHLDLLEDTCGEGWLHIRLRPGQNKGVPIARTDGVTLYTPAEQVSFLKGLRLDFYADISGGGFLISPPENAESCGCGAGFKPL